MSELERKMLEPMAIPSVAERTGSDAFENAIRAFGVGNACEWFGHAFDSDFAKETASELICRYVSQA